MGEVIQLQGDQRKDVQEFLIDKDGLQLDAKTIKVYITYLSLHIQLTHNIGPWFLDTTIGSSTSAPSTRLFDRSRLRNSLLHFLPFLVDGWVERLRPVSTLALVDTRIL